ncbi:MAG TPA: error-prone DNA polymerase [Xanthobacteraceae bacterium]|nr:error-prone DNA polymerase [Xanthobacteraceae bacterium]
MTVPYAEIGVTTNFSFLRGASHPGEMIVAASGYGLKAIGIADRNTLAGVVRAYAELENPELKYKPKLLVGARLVFADGTPDILAYPRNLAAYGRLCRLLTRGNLRAKKGECILHFSDLAEFREGLLLAVIPPEKVGVEIEKTLLQLRAAGAGKIWLCASLLYRGNDRRRLRKLQDISQVCKIPLIATNDVLYHDHERRKLQDVLTCVREKCTIEQAGRKLEKNAERHLKPGEEMARLFREMPEAIEETLRFADQIDFSLNELKYRYPDEPVPPGKTAQQHLEDLVWENVPKKFPGGLRADVRKKLMKEFALIKERDYAHYFLTVHDVVRYANSQGILCQGRGSAANSVVCYVLGVTAVNPENIDVLFERFLSANRTEPPDIDVDFEHERREEVIQWVFERYGRHRAAIAATIIRYRPRSAIRDAGKALGLTEDVTAAIAGTVWGYGDGPLTRAQILQAGLDPENRMIRLAIDLSRQLLGFPRHLSQHVGGFVLTQSRLDELVPIANAAMEDRTFIEWDKDDIDTVNMMKVDVLALGMLTCIRKAFDLIALYDKKWTLPEIPHEDRAVYEMLQRGDAIGVFQVESRAQMNMLPRLKPNCFYDLVIEVAIVRPGPIQGDMVHPYLQRRKAPQSVVYPSPSPEHGHKDELKRVLEKTLGVPLFQEQAMQIAIEAAKFTPEEANSLRRSMATFRHMGDIHKFRDKLVGGMVNRGYAREFAERCFNQIEGFGTYGFPESHAASFANLVYASAWIKCYHPAAFACALLNSQPMGFYAPAEIVRDAREHDVELRPIDVNYSEWDNTLEIEPGKKPALRLGFRQIDGMKGDWGRAIVEKRGGGFSSLESVALRTRLPKRAMILLADADCFRSVRADRREALWSVRRLPDDDELPLFAAKNLDGMPEEAKKPLPEMPLSEHVMTDYQTIRLSLKGHPLQFLRERLRAKNILPCAAASAARDRQFARVAGVVLIRQQPGSAKGVIFVTLSDETGITNVVIWPDVMKRYRREVMSAKLLLVEGQIQRSEEGVVHLVAQRLVDATAALRSLADREPRASRSRADEVLHPQAGRDARRHPRNVRILPKSRDFH